MIDTSESARIFGGVALETFGRCGVTTGTLATQDEFALGEDDVIVLLGVVGAWRGAVAFRFDPGAVAGTSEAMAGEPVEEQEVQFEALLEEPPSSRNKPTGPRSGSHRRCSPRGSPCSYGCRIWPATAFITNWGPEREASCSQLPQIWEGNYDSSRARPLV